MKRSCLCASTLLTLVCLAICPLVRAQAISEGCEAALQKFKDKKVKNLPYVCPRQLGESLEDVLAQVKESTPNGYTLEKAVLHIETGSTTEIDAGINLVVFAISYKRKKGLTQSMDSNFGLQEKKELAALVARRNALASVKGEGPTARDHLIKAINDAVEVASGVTTLPTDSVVAKVQFSISNDLNAGVSFVILGNGSKATAGIDFTKTSVNSIEITMKKNKPSTPSGL